MQTDVDQLLDNSPTYDWGRQGYVPYTDTRRNATERANFSTGIPVELVSKIVNGAIKRGLDPHEAVAQGIQESSMGRWDNAQNPLNMSRSLYNPETGFIHPEVSKPIPPRDYIDAALNYKWHLQNNRFPNNLDRALQAFQGLGFLKRGKDLWKGATQNAGKTMPYVKRVRDIMSTFQHNPELLSIINQQRRGVTKKY